jgi:hypothetical protein
LINRKLAHLCDVLIPNNTAKTGIVWLISKNDTHLVILPKKLTTIGGA